MVLSAEHHHRNPGCAVEKSPELEPTLGLDVPGAKKLKLDDGRRYGFRHLNYRVSPGLTFALHA